MSFFIPTAANLFKEPICVKILSGKGFSYESVDALEILVNLFFSKCEIEKVDEKQLHFKDIKLKNILLIIPGASDLSKIELTREQQREIEVFCKQGLIKVLGVCAGAFYLSKNILYEGVPKKSSKDVFLFNGTCSGPVFSKDSDGWKLSAEKVSLLLEKKTLTGFLAFLGGGCFEPSEEIQEGKDYTVLARYEETEEGKVSAIACCPGEHSYHAVLIGPHLEYSHHTPSFQSLKAAFPHKYAKIQEVIDKLSATESFRLTLARKSFEALGFK